MVSGTCILLDTSLPQLIWEKEANSQNEGLEDDPNIFRKG